MILNNEKKLNPTTKTTGVKTICISTYEIDV